MPPETASSQTQTPRSTKDLEQLRNGIQRALSSFQGEAPRRQVRSTPPAEGGGWPMNLPVEPDPAATPSTCGTYCILGALLASGYERRTPCVAQATQYLTWTARSVRTDRVELVAWGPLDHDAASPTRSTCLALDALTMAVATEEQSRCVTGGLEWLLHTQKTGGGDAGSWALSQNLSRSGLLPGDLTSTSYAIKTLAEAERSISVSAIGPDLRRRIRDAIGCGCSWLEERKAEDHWSDSTEPNGSNDRDIAHTSHVVEALLDGGRLRPDERVAIARWLCQRLETVRSEEDAVIYGQRAWWTHLLHERGLIALLRLGERVSNPTLARSVVRILDRQDGGFWKSPGDPRGPSWATIEAVRSLKLYLDRLERDFPSERLRLLENRIQRLDEAALARRSASLDRRLRRLETGALSRIMGRVESLPGTYWSDVLVLGCFVLYLLLALWGYSLQRSGTPGSAGTAWLIQCSQDLLLAGPLAVLFEVFRARAKSQQRASGV